MPSSPLQLLNIPGIIGEPNAQLSPPLLQQRLNALDHIHQDLLPRRSHKCRPFLPCFTHRNEIFCRSMYVIVLPVKTYKEGKPSKKKRKTQQLILLFHSFIFFCHIILMAEPWPNGPILLKC
jgi:hypothetical protein